MSELAKLSWRLPESFLTYNMIHLFVCFAGILTNAVLQIQFWKNRSHIKASSVPLLHISICDTLLLTATAVSCIALDITRELSWTWCQVNGFSIIFFIAPSALSFTVISIDRYKQIISGHPTTRREMSFMLFMTWIASAVIAMLPLATETFFVPQAAKVYCLGKMFGSTTGHRIYGSVTSVIIVIACSIVGGCYYSIYKKAIADGFKWRGQTFVSTELLRETTEAYESADKSAKKSNVKGTSTGTGANSTNSVSGSKPKSNAKQNDAYKKQLQLTIKLALLTLYFYTTWSPTLASYIYQMISNQPVSPEFDFFSTLLTNGASVVNPILVLSMDSRWRLNMPKVPWRRREEDL
ncbi:hypothetical protein BKA69DRAFT_1168500 [Paraphysoderma sedebokerense]|nr:hypothetical protein BKA69DRAFT_1168500 [Paraphysoderma sedebokerense]